jgi:hypothetical protein
MTLCAKCQQQNQDDAKYCFYCGTPVAGDQTQPVETAPYTLSTDLWRQFIGPNADRYLEQFKKFGTEQEPKFALTWNWPAFLFISFLWFLYRKMYLYAAVYAVGPMISTFITGDMSIGIAWSIIAGATGNYIYYWHCREQIAEIKKKGWNDPAGQDQTLKDAGGVQQYVIYVGVAFYVLFIMTMIKLLQDGPPDGERSPGKPAKPTATSRV